MTSDSANAQRLELADGAVVRRATFDDIPALASLVADRMGPEDELDLKLVAETRGGPRRYRSRRVAGARRLRRPRCLMKNFEWERSRCAPGRSSSSLAPQLTNTADTCVRSWTGAINPQRLGGMWFR